MSNQSWIPLVRRASLFGVAAMLATGVAFGQSTSSQTASASQTPSQSSPAGASVSQSVSQTASQAASWSDSDATSGQVAELAAPRSLSALPSAPTPSASAAGGGRGGVMHSIWSNFAFEVGGGFNAPESSSITYGGNFTIGGGVNFNKHLTGLIEYQFIDDKLPGALIAETDGAATGGHAHIWSFTMDPVVDLFPKASNDLYATGGGGFYRKVTSFTFPQATEFCSYFYCGIGYVPGTVGHFSSNQGGWSIGGGYIHRMGGIYGTSKMKLFAEVRYLDVLSPAIIGKSANGLPPVTIKADTMMIPVTLGVRW